MIEEEQHIERIEAWYAGKMILGEKETFEEELASSQELRELAEKHTYLLDGFEGMKVQAFAEHLRQSHPSHAQPEGKRNLWTMVAVAASVIILIGISFFVVQPSGMQRIAMEYYAAPLAEISRSESPDENSFFQKGMLAFAQKEWDGAISAFNQIKASDPDYLRGLYFEAHAHVAGKRYAQALTMFTDPVFRNGPLQQQAEWNSVLMLMYLQYPTSEIAEGLHRIENNTDHFYDNKAAEVLKELEPD